MRRRPAASRLARGQTRTDAVVREMLRNRHPLREKDARRVADAVSAAFGAAVNWDGKRVETADSQGFSLYLVDGVPMAFDYEGQAVPTVKGLLEAAPKARFVTVDEGAVPFILKGADIMAPGIVDADRGVRPGDVVWVREEKHLRPLAVGAALISGEEMIVSKKGKAVRTIHHLRDKLWSLIE